jgi:hypothetical protein
MTFKNALIGVCLCLLLVSIALAEVPQMINYQGKLTTPEGALIDTTILMTFAIYTDSVGTDSLWSETQASVVVEKGIFSVLLGSVNPIPDSVFTGETRYLGVKPGDDSEMTPRIAIVSVAYAYRAGTADGGGGGNCGWVDDGTVVRLETSTDNVGIGTTSPTAKLEVSGDAFISGKATIGPNHINGGVGGFVAGVENYTSGSQPTVGGGNFNSATGSQPMVGGGYLNGAIGDRATVSGGHHNVADTGSTVGGGGYNKARGEYSVVSGGGGATSSDSNSATGDYSAIGGGRGNAASGYASTVGGGYSNTANATRTTVGGGDNNTASGNYSTVGGGNNNTASGTESTVAGGNNNSATQYLATVGGGNSNYATASRSTVAGGDNNVASGSRSAVGGGESNIAYGDYSTIGGGYYNLNQGDYCVIPGGERDTILSATSYTMVFGKGVYERNNYRVVFFDGANSGALIINHDYRDGSTSHPIHVGTNSSNGNGAHLTTGGTWTNGSSRAFKENGRPIGGQELLTQISTLPVESWQYRDSDERHIGPYAEDFAAAFEVGSIKEDGTRESQYLAAGDVAGVALAGVKELARQNQELKQIIEDLRQRIEELEKSK